MFKKILIANRGEIALRIIRCCLELGIETVAVYSTEDADSLPVQLANEAVCIGRAPARDSYLNMQAILEAAKGTGANAIHPGFGFLSENADFAAMCEEKGVTFLGPSSETMKKMGDKQSARQLMRETGVPVTPGSEGLIRTAAEAETEAERIGYPVLLKASAGGGGRGMRRAYDRTQIRQAYETARAEAEAAFGNGDMYMEKLILHPHHVEVQILADRQGNVLSLGERDCSMQRRNQKLMEEAPCPFISDDLRRRLENAAVLAAKAAGYYSAGTVEFIVDSEEHFYFCEMNTRIQVEHPVTEMVTGIDLIREQIRIAAGLPLPCRQEDISVSGHAIECRINAEDTAQQFRPSPGTVRFLHLPGGPGVRVDSALYQGCEISPFYDSCAAKVIVHGKNRLEAIRRMRAALAELMIDGVKTDTDFLYLILYHPDYLKGRYDTSFIEQHAEELLEWNRQAVKNDER